MVRVPCLHHQYQYQALITLQTKKQKLMSHYFSFEPGRSYWQSTGRTNGISYHMIPDTWLPGMVPGTLEHLLATVNTWYHQYQVPGNVWPLLAACHVYILHTTSKMLHKSTSVYSKYQEELVRCITEQKYSSTSITLNFSVKTKNNTCT